MKSKVILSFLTTLVILFVLCSCSNRRIDVEIDENGNASNGSVFYLIDDKNFYLDYIKYSVVEGHLEVSGYDKAGIKAEPQIVSSITYKKNKLEVLSIGKEAFSDCENLTSITIPDGVTNIGEYAFSGCENLTSMAIPNSVTNIGEYAFMACRGLTSLTIPQSVTNIGDYAFKSCSGLTSIEVESKNNVYDSRDKCNAIIETSTNMLIVGCNNSTIPNSVTIIGEGAFSGRSGMTSVTIGKNVTFICGDAFKGCSGLTSIKVERGNMEYDSRDNCNAIIESSTNTLIVGCNNSTIPNGITSICGDAFFSCDSLTTVTIPNSVTSIGERAFQGVFRDL